MKAFNLITIIVLMSACAFAGPTATSYIPPMGGRGNLDIKKMNDWALQLQKMGPANHKTNNTVYMLTGFKHQYYQSGWVSADSTNYSYTQDAHETSEQSYTYNTSNSHWDNNQKIRFSYNGNLLSEVLYQNWNADSSSFINSGHWIITWYNNNQIQYWTWQWFDLATLSWQNSDRYYQIFDANGNETNNIHQNYDQGTSSYINDWQYLQTFDTDNRMTSKIRQTYQSGTGWINTDRTLYNFATGTNNYETVVNQQWSTSSSHWLDINKSTYTYDGNNDSTQALIQIYNGSSQSFDNSTRATYTYDVNRLQIQEEYDSFYVASSTYEHTYKEDYTYDANNNWLTTVSQTYTLASSQYNFYDRRFNYYQAFTVSGIEETATINNMSMYPNPATGGQAIVSFNLKADATIAINMYDMTGKLVSRQTNQYGAGDNKTSISTGQLSAGIYQVQWVNLKDNSVASLKLSVQ